MAHNPYYGVCKHVLHCGGAQATSGIPSSDSSSTLAGNHLANSVLTSATLYLATVYLSTSTAATNTHSDIHTESTPEVPAVSHMATCSTKSTT